MISRTHFGIIVLIIYRMEHVMGLCAEGTSTTFQLITGAIFMMEQGKIGQFQTFDINDCFTACRNNSQCYSANFETGLCTTSQFNASMMPDSLRTDDFPVFPNYLEKLCLNVPESCNRQWSFQGVVNYYLAGWDTKIVKVASKEECLNACLNEASFICYSAELDYGNMSCSLSNASQSILQTKLQKVTDGRRLDYFENNCAKDLRTYCEYNRFRGRVLKAADVVRSKVASLDECKTLCLTSNSNFSCNYYHYAQLSEDECSLSHHTANTVSHISEPYVFSADFVSYELRACFGIHLTCEAKKMSVQIETDRVFDGLVYAKEQPKTCLLDVNNSTLFQLTMPLDGTVCNTANNGRGTYSNYIMIQYNDKIVTSKDMGLSVSCEYDLGSRNVTGTLNTNGAPTITENVNYKVPSPVVQMTIRNSEGNPLGTATVGDKIYLQFDLAQSGSPDIYNIFVKDVVAVDGPGKTKIKMIDSNGCPSDDIVLGPVESINDGKTLRIPIEAFKFPSNDEVEFMALIKPCQKQCEPAQCIDDATQIVYNSFGKRRRRRRDIAATESHIADKQGDDDVLVYHRISINDIFSACPNGGKDCLSDRSTAQAYQNAQPGNFNGRQLDTTGIVCIHKLAIAVASSVILLIQVVFGVALAFICQRYRAHRKPHFKASFDVSSPSPVSGSPSTSTSDVSSSTKSLQNYKRPHGSPVMVHRMLPASQQESHS